VIVVEHKGKYEEYSPEEISCMLLNNLKESDEAFLATEVVDAVIIVLAYFSDKQRHPIKDAGTLAALNIILSALVAEVPSASALQVLRRLGSIFTSVYAVVQKLKKDSWLELQFSLADNSKLNINKFEGDNTPIVIQPPCYSASKIPRDQQVVSEPSAVKVPQTLEYRGGQLNVAPVLEVENFTNWKKSFLCHIIGIEPQFENIIKNGLFIPMTAGQRKPENKWTGDERKTTNLNQRLKSLITK
ncbi:retrovirus-related pol polyprotein from transposon TNT 1-94, partial [Tanacetum coccineum]